MAHTDEGPKIKHLTKGWNRIGYLGSSFSAAELMQ
jgi:hypothetical protein